MTFSRLILTLFGVLMITLTTAQQHKHSDSLYSTYISKSAEARQTGSLDSMKHYADLAYDRSKELGDTMAMYDAMGLQVLQLIFTQNMEEAGKKGRETIELIELHAENNPDEFHINLQRVKSYNRAAEIFSLINQYEESVRFTFKALSASEQLHEKWPDEPETIEIMNAVSIKLINQYVTNKKYDLALDQSHQLLDRLDSRLEDTLDITVILYKLSVVQNMANMYSKIGDSTASSQYREIQNKLFLKHESELLNTFGGKGLLGFYFNAGEYEKAIQLAEDLYEKEKKNPVAKSMDVASLELSIGQGALGLGDFNKAIKFGELAYETLHEKQFKSFELMAVNILATAYGQTKNYKKAYEFVMRKNELESELEVDQQSAMFSNYQYQYETSKQEEIDSLNALREAEAHQREIERQKLQTESERKTSMLYLAGVGVLLVIGGFLVWTTLRSRKTAKLISEQKDKVDEAYGQLEIKNTEILDSINYAKRIQSAILPTDQTIKNSFKNAFVLYKPKDIVAGDFYWLEEFEGSIYFACADCTGHGVPGAMVSVVCSNALSKALIEERITDPGKILDRTREIVIDQFGKADQEIRDGMDVSLVRLSNTTVEFSGANNPLWIIRRGGSDVEEIKANKQPIGKYAKEEPFTSHKVDLNEGDSIYMFSDGYPDQFGGPKGKKFKAANLKKLLLSLQSEDIPTQKDRLHLEFENWRGDLEQIDDVCVTGIRI